MQQYQRYSCCEKVEIFFSQRSGFLNVHVYFFKAAVLVLQQQDQVDVNEREKEQREGEIQALHKVHLDKEGEIESPDEHSIDRYQFHD